MGVCGSTTAIVDEDQTAVAPGGTCQVGADIVDGVLQNDSKYAAEVGSRKVAARTGVVGIGPTKLVRRQSSFRRLGTSELKVPASSYTLEPTRSISPSKNSDAESVAAHYDIAAFRQKLGGRVVLNAVEIRSLLGILAPAAPEMDAQALMDYYQQSKLHLHAAAVFFSNLVHFLKLRLALDARWKSLSHRAEAEAIKAKPGTPRNSAKTLDELYASAEENVDAFQELLRGVAQVANATFSVAPLKGRERAKIKIRDDYGGDVQRLVDVVRGKITIQNGVQAVQIMDQLQKVAVRVKNRCGGALSGYRDILVNVSVNGHVCEVQVHFHDLLEVDTQMNSHIAYEYFRSYYRGNVESIQGMLNMLLELREHVLGANSLGDAVKSVLGDQDTQYLWNKLAEVLRTIGEMQLALSVQQTKLDVCMRLCGESATETLHAVNKLGVLKSEAGNQEEAEQLYIRALSGYEKTLGTNNIETLMTANNLGSLMTEMGRLAEARNYLVRSLKGMEALHGLEHEDTAVVANNLANLMTEIGELEEATEIYERVLKIKERTLGKDHPNTSMAANNLGTVLNEIGDLDGARALFEQALSGYEKSLGPDHPDTLNTVHNLATLYDALGNEDNATRFYKRALVGKEDVLGRAHPETLNTVQNLGLLMKQMGDTAEAKVYLQRALDGYEKALGRNHPDTLMACNNFGSLLDATGDKEGAKSMYERAIEGYTETLAKTHPDACFAMYNLGCLLSDTGDNLSAKSLFQQAYDGFCQTHGPKHEHAVAAAKALQAPS